MREGYRNKLTSLFHFFEFISNFCTTPVREFSMMVLQKMSMRIAAICTSSNETVVSFLVEVETDYEDER